MKHHKYFLELASVASSDSSVAQVDEVDQLCTNLQGLHEDSLVRLIKKTTN